MVTEDISRLPKWAQRKIGRLENEVASLKLALESVGKDHPGTNVKISGFSIMGPDTELPKNAEVQFYLGAGPYKQYVNMISVRHANDTFGELSVHSSAGPLIIQPSVSNHVYLSIARA